jgi:hypothetical protein
LRAKNFQIIRRGFSLDGAKLSSCNGAAIFFRRQCENFFLTSFACDRIEKEADAARAVINAAVFVGKKARKQFMREVLNS